MAYKKNFFIVKSANTSLELSHLVFCNNKKFEKTQSMMVTVKKQSPCHLLFVYTSDVNLTVRSEPNRGK